MAADDRDVVQAGGVAHALERRPAGGLVAHQRVHDRERHGAHGGDIVDVGEHRGDAGTEGVLLEEGGQDGLAAHHVRLTARPDDRAVVTRALAPVGGAEHVPEDVTDHSDVALRPPTRTRAHRIDDRPQVGAVSPALGMAVPIHG